MSIRKYIYASLAFICLMCSCDPWLVPPVKITYEEDANGYKYVDLGLSVKWAAYDIGANSATELGDFFAWGETQPKKDYSWDTYKFAVPYKSPESGTRIFDNGYGKEYELTKYNLDPNSEYYDGKTTLDLIDDVAHMAWGGNWRMPTKAECEELLEKCEWTRTEYLGVYGYDVKGPNGNRIFLPDNMKGSDMLYQDGTRLYRWSNNNDNDYNYNLEVFAYMMAGDGFGKTQRFLGLFVRAVYDKSLPKYSVLTFDANGGEGLMHPQQFNKGVSQSIDSVRYTNGVLNFVAWNTQPDGSGQSFANGQEITLDKNTTLYAQWALATGSENGYDYVDLGLPSGTKWAIYNVGATSPEGFGDYFAWGETQAKDSYSWDNYKFGQDYRELTKYCHDSYFGQNGFVDYLETLELTDDAAQVNWGGNWRMPSKEEFVELYANCSFSWYSHNGVEGTLVVSRINKNRIFFPAAGEMYGDGLSSSGTDGSFWTSSNETSAYNFYYYLNVTHILDNDIYYTDTSTYVNIGTPSRYVGLPVRAVFNGELPAYYTITFDANGGEGTMSAQTFEAGVTQTLAANKFTRSGYYFSGWNTAPDGSDISYTDGQELTLTQDMTLYAQWALATGSENDHEWVDLGLPSGLKWATCNVGANTPEGYGDYFAWGETSPKDNYDWSTYKYCNGLPSTLTKYNTKSNYGNNGFTDNKTILDLSDDAARVNWGGKWRMPTTAEQDELINNCTWTWTTQNGVNGYKVTSNTNGNSIFLPATGYRNDTHVGNVGSTGMYWSSSLDSSEPNRAGRLRFDSSVEDVNVNSSGPFRDSGRTVRAVFSENDTPSTFVTLTFDANGGSGTMSAQLFEAGVTQTLAPNKFTRSGYYFSGWNTAPDGSGTSYTDSQEITLTEDVTLYAQWKQVKGTENGHEWVDLGLPSGLKWATCNVGATTPEGYGDYFAWGETEPKTNYDWSTYKYCNGSYSTLTKYNTESSRGTVDNKPTLELADDAARANWGGSWRMPTKAEQDELRNNCTLTWTTQNGVNGYKVTSKTNGNSIFLPAAGFRVDSVYDDGSYGYYWSSSLNENYLDCAYFLIFDSDDVGWNYYGRDYGLTVRAVCP